MGVTAPPIIMHEYETIRRKNGLQEYADSGQNQEAIQFVPHDQALLRVLAA